MVSSPEATDSREAGSIYTNRDVSEVPLCMTDSAFATSIAPATPAETADRISINNGLIGIAVSRMDGIVAHRMPSQSDRAGRVKRQSQQSARLVWRTGAEWRFDWPFSPTYKTIIVCNLFCQEMPLQTRRIQLNGARKRRHRLQ
jgi:hypothetical protein